MHDSNIMHHPTRNDTDENGAIPEISRCPACNVAVASHNAIGYPSSTWGNPDLHDHAVAHVVGRLAIAMMVSLKVSTRWLMSVLAAVADGVAAWTNGDKSSAIASVTDVRGSIPLSLRDGRNPAYEHRPTCSTPPRQNGFSVHRAVWISLPVPYASATT